MSIPNEALQKLLVEIEQNAAVTQQQLVLVKAQIAAKRRESRMLQLTSNEIKGLTDETHVYEGVGKMFVLTQPSVVGERLSSEEDELQKDISNFEKKLNYLETTKKNSEEHLSRLFRSSNGQ